MTGRALALNNLGLKAEGVCVVCEKAVLRQDMATDFCCLECEIYVLDCEALSAGEEYDAEA